MFSHNYSILQGLIRVLIPDFAFIISRQYEEVQITPGTTKRHYDVMTWKRFLHHDVMTWKRFLHYRLLAVCEGFSSQRASDMEL